MGVNWWDISAVDWLSSIPAVQNCEDTVEPSLLLVDPRTFYLSPDVTRVLFHPALLICRCTASSYPRLRHKLLQGSWSTYARHWSRVKYHLVNLSNDVFTLIATPYLYWKNPHSPSTPTACLGLPAPLLDAAASKSRRSVVGSGGVLKEKSPSGRPGGCREREDGWVNGFGCGM